MRHHPGRFRPQEATAFAEGRRLRETAEMRRRRRRARHPSWHGAPSRRRGLHTLLLLLLAVPIASLMIFSVGVALVFGVVALHAFTPVLFFVAIAATGVRRRRRREVLRRGGAAGTAPLPGRPAARPRPEQVWSRAGNRFHVLRAEYAGFECDPMEVLRLPALADVSVGSTARFVDAFAEAQALETDLLPPPAHATAFVAAVDRAERAWRAARDAAERIRLSGLAPAERGTVERVIKLLTTARDSDSGPERLAAYARARSELTKLDRAGVVHLPRSAAAALDSAARGALPA